MAACSASSSWPSPLVSTSSKPPEKGPETSSLERRPSPFVSRSFMRALICSVMRANRSARSSDSRASRRSARSSALRGNGIDGSSLTTGFLGAGGSSTSGTSGAGAGADRSDLALPAEDFLFTSVRGRGGRSALRLSAVAALSSSPQEHNPKATTTLIIKSPSFIWRIYNGTEIPLLSRSYNQPAVRTSLPLLLTRPATPAPR